MEQELIGRKRELGILNAAYESGKFEFAVIYGRRRVGKSFLIEHFLKNKNAIYFEAVHRAGQKNLLLLSRTVANALYDNESIEYSSYIGVFDDIAKKARDERLVFVIDEISYLAEDDEAFLGLLQHYVDGAFKKSKLMLILSGSSRRFIEEKILSNPSPLYDRRTLQLKLMPFSTEESAQMFSNWSLHDVAAAHVITGGIPYYENFLARHATIDEALRSEFFLPGSSLFTEARLFLMSEYRAVSSYESVLMQLAAGVVEVSKIRDKTGLSDANISQMLISLEGQEIVERKKKVVDRGVAKGWRISDGYFLFYYKYVFPYFSLIERGHGNGAAMKAISSLDSFVGKAMEKYFIEYVLSHSELLITEIGSIDFPNPTKRGNEEVDLIGRYDGGFILGECKWQNDKTGLSVFLILQERSRMLFPQGAEIKYYILSRCGFTDELEMEGSKRNDLTLIPGEDLFGMKNTPL